MALRFQHARFLWFPVVTRALDINTDSSCSETTDLDMAFGSSLGLDITMAPVAAQVTQITMTLVKNGLQTPT